MLLTRPAVLVVPNEGVLSALKEVLGIVTVGAEGAKLQYS